MELYINIDLRVREILRESDRDQPSLIIIVNADSGKKSDAGSQIVTDVRG